MKHSARHSTKPPPLLPTEQKWRASLSELPPDVAARVAKRKVIAEAAKKVFWDKIPLSPPRR